jgi:hypothetical protein
MDAHMAKIMAEARLHGLASFRIERLAQSQGAHEIICE